MLNKIIVKEKRKKHFLAIDEIPCLLVASKIIITEYCATAALTVYNKMGKGRQVAGPATALLVLSCCAELPLSIRATPSLLNCYLHLNQIICIYCN